MCAAKKKPQKKRKYFFLFGFCILFPAFPGGLLRDGGLPLWRPGLLRLDHRAAGRDRRAPVLGRDQERVMPVRVRAPGDMPNRRFEY